MLTTHTQPLSDLWFLALPAGEGDLYREAHLSAEDPPSFARAWFSRAHEVDWRSACPRRASRAWPQATHCRL